MLTIDKIKGDFSFIEDFSETSEVYHDSPVFQGYGNFCDLYFISKDKHIKQGQVDIYNEFRANFKEYIPEIGRYIISSLKDSEINSEDTIRQSNLTLDVIEIPFDNIQYDMVLICSKTYRKFLFLKKNINARVEFKNGKIRSIQRL